MQASNIDLQALKQAVNSILDHMIEDLKLSSVPIEQSKDLYWDCPAPEIYNSSKKPTDLTVGRLSDDLDFTGSIQRGQSADVAYNLIHVAPLLRYLGETVQR
jgi:hypothetical protein